MNPLELFYIEFSIPLAPSACKALAWGQFLDLLAAVYHKIL